MFLNISKFSSFDSRTSISAMLQLTRNNVSLNLSASGAILIASNATCHLSELSSKFLMAGGIFNVKYGKIGHHE